MTTANHPDTLQWSDALVLDMPVMDATHQEFVALLAEVVHATDEVLLPSWSALIAHTQEHFDREDQWMQDTGFAAGNCHATQHKVILQVMREGEASGHGGDLAVVRHMARELGLWFPQHAQSMDASLALHLRSAGYDPETGALSQHEHLPLQAIHGCGGGCGEAA
ncbi:hemerythrin [Rhodoferax saidenbachensis]|uniref:Hemerythrin n=2 Tax=Rhodoferax saidenbachensis TaxID=1484693 RepID=A0A1P8KFI7_9BURK|nr:hemerythrin [Rhodoferax saidenbachensis]